MAFRVPIEKPQPSQLFLSGRKLHAATEWFDFDEPSYEPIRVIRLDGELVCIDGHTRAYLARLAGAEELLVTETTDEGHPMELYADCVGWCQRKDLTSVADFAGRVVSHESYERRWIDRCRRVANILSG
jgi:hypothetical protein